MRAALPGLLGADAGAGVLDFLSGEDLVRLGGVCGAARAAAGGRLDRAAAALASGGPAAAAAQGRGLASAVSRAVVLAIADRPDAEAADEAADDAAAPRRLRERWAPRDPAAALRPDHRRATGPRLHGGDAWAAACRHLGEDRFSAAWWARPELIAAAGLALLDAHCAFCAKHLPADVAESLTLRFDMTASRAVCAACNELYRPHHARFMRNDVARLARLRASRKRAWPFCSHRNEACMDYHHARQGACECPCHGPNDD
jgi:hypothetical protein